MPVFRIKSDKNSGTHRVVYQGGGEHAWGPFSDVEHARAVARQANKAHEAVLKAGRGTEDVQAQASHINATANLLREERLAKRAESLQRVGQEAAKLEGGSSVGYKNLADKQARKIKPIGE